MDERIFDFFRNAPLALPLYAALADRIGAAFGPVDVIAYKTQINFARGRGFAFVWLPMRRIKARPETYLLVTFVLPYRLAHERIIKAVEARRGRWTHHVIVAYPDDANAELLGWIAEAYALVNPPQ